MGNRDRPTRRLSKPRSLKDSPSNQALASSSPLAFSEADYFSDTPVTDSKGQRRSKSKSRSKLRAYLYGPSNEASQTLSSEEDTDSRSSHSSRKARKRLFESGSPFTQHSDAKGSSTQLLNALNPKLLDDANPEDPQIVAEQLKQRAQEHRLAADHQASPPPFDSQFEEFFPPSRRKSFNLPGLATRDIRIISDVLRKPPQRPSRNISEADRNYYYNPLHPQSSPLSSLAALKLPEDGRATPTSLDIPHLGGLRLGTLHVTNVGSTRVMLARSDGACHSPTLSCTDRDEYHTASEASVDNRERSQEELAEAHLTSGPNVPPPTEEVINAAEKELERPTTSTHEYSHKYQCASAMAAEYIAELCEAPFMGGSTHSDANTVHDIIYSDFARLSDCRLTSIEPWKAEMHRSTSYSRAFGPEMDRWKHQGEGLETDSRCQKLLDPLPRDADDHLEEPSAWTCDSGYHSHESVDDFKTIGDHALGHQLRASPRLLSDPRENPCLSEEQEASYVDLQGNIPKPAELNQTHSAIKEETRCGNALSASNRGRKLRKSRPKSPVLLQTLNLESHDLNGASIPRVPTAMALKHAERVVDFPLLEHTFPSPEHVKPSYSPRLVDNSQTVPLRFPSPVDKSRFTEYCKPTDLVNPRPSVSMLRKPVSPMDEGPVEKSVAISCPKIMRSPSWSAFGRQGKDKQQKELVKKAKRKRRQHKKKAKNDAKLREEEKKERERRMREEAKRKHSRSRSRSRSRPWPSSLVSGKSPELRTSPEEPVGTIADLGTVTESLGPSPYDIATKLESETSRDRAICHPHRLTSPRRRPRSFVGMDDALTSEFANARSRLRQQAHADNALESEPRPRTVFLETFDTPALQNAYVQAPDSAYENRQRHRCSWSEYSYVKESALSDTSFHDCGDIPRKALRPHTGLVDAPPVPALPSTKHFSRADPPRRKDLSVSSSYNAEQDRVSQEPNLDLRPQTQRSNISGLWTNGSLDRRGEQSRIACPSDERTRDVPPESASIEWKTHQSAWLERRKSAGVALLTQNRCVNTWVSGSSVDKIGGQNRMICREGGSSPASKTNVSPSIAAVATRFEGSLQLGYERECGLSGSTGTRVWGIGAAGKGVKVGKGYGQNLSDLPVYVAATPR